MLENNSKKLQFLLWKIQMRHFLGIFEHCGSTLKHHNCFTLTGKKNDAFLTELEKLWSHIVWKSPKMSHFNYSKKAKIALVYYYVNFGTKIQISLLLCCKMRLFIVIFNHCVHVWNEYIFEWFHAWLVNDESRKKKVKKKVKSRLSYLSHAM